MKKGDDAFNALADFKTVDTVHHPDMGSLRTSPGCRRRCTAAAHSAAMAQMELDSPICT